MHAFSTFSFSYGNSIGFYYILALHPTPLLYLSFYIYIYSCLLIFSYQSIVLHINYRHFSCEHPEGAIYILNLSFRRYFVCIGILSILPVSGCLYLFIFPSFSFLTCPRCSSRQILCIVCYLCAYNNFFFTNYQIAIKILELSALHTTLSYLYDSYWHFFFPLGLFELLFLLQPPVFLLY